MFGCSGADGGKHEKKGNQVVGLAVRVCRGRDGYGRRRG